MAQELRKRLGSLGTGMLHIELGSPWENGHCESFNGKLRDECLEGEIFYSLKEGRAVIESRQQKYNTRRPHSALGWLPHRTYLGVATYCTPAPGWSCHCARTETNPPFFHQIGNSTFDLSSFILDSCVGKRSSIPAAVKVNTLCLQWPRNHRAS
jgi:hypothetical protein